MYNLNLLNCLNVLLLTLLISENNATHFVILMIFKFFVINGVFYSVCYQDLYTLTSFFKTFWGFGDS